VTEETTFRVVFEVFHGRERIADLVVAGSGPFVQKGLEALSGLLQALPLKPEEKVEEAQP
jgi:hypothetical protein